MPKTTPQKALWPCACSVPVLVWLQSLHPLHLPFPHLMGPQGTPDNRPTRTAQAQHIPQSLGLPHRQRWLSSRQIGEVGKSTLQVMGPPIQLNIWQSRPQWLPRPGPTMPPHCPRTNWLVSPTSESQLAPALWGHLGGSAAWEQPRLVFPCPAKCPLSLWISLSKPVAQVKVA